MTAITTYRSYYGAQDNYNVNMITYDSRGGDNVNGMVKSQGLWKQTVLDGV